MRFYLLTPADTWPCWWEPDSTKLRWVLTGRVTGSWDSAQHPRLEPQAVKKCWTLISILVSIQVSRDPGAQLWLADIQRGVREANQDSQKALKCKSDLTEFDLIFIQSRRKYIVILRLVCSGARFWTFPADRCLLTMSLCSVCLSVAAVNQAVKENQVNQTLRVLTLPEVQLQGIISACAEDYQRELYSLMTDRMHRGPLTHRSQQITHRYISVSHHDFFFRTFYLFHIDNTHEDAQKSYPLQLQFTQSSSYYLHS